jgi:hypothetical protein
VWSLSDDSSSSESSSVSQHSNKSLVDKVVMPIKYLADTTLVLGGDVSLDHVVMHPIQPMVEEVVALDEIFGRSHSFLGE